MGILNRRGFSRTSRGLEHDRNPVATEILIPECWPVWIKPSQILHKRFFANPVIEQEDPRSSVAEKIYPPQLKIGITTLHLLSPLHRGNIFARVISLKVVRQSAAAGPGVGLDSRCTPPKNGEETQNRQFVAWRPLGISTLYNEPCLPYNAMLFRVHLNVKLRPYVSQATDCTWWGQASNSQMRLACKRSTRASLTHSRGRIRVVRVVWLLRHAIRRVDSLAAPPR